MSTVMSSAESLLIPAWTAALSYKTAVKSSETSILSRNAGALTTISRLSLLLSGDGLGF